MDDRTALPSEPTPGDRRQSSRARSTSQGLGETMDNSGRSTPIAAPQAEDRSLEDESLAPSRSLRRRKSGVSNGTASDPVQEAMKPLTEAERKAWKGWVELESDPVGFLALLPFAGRFHGQVWHSITNSHLRLFSATFYGHTGPRMSRSRRFLGSTTIRYSTYCTPQ